MVKIGIPRSLLYYKYFPLWKSFFENLGVKVVFSPSTNKSILDSGSKYVVDEACLPLKVYFGHVNYLKDKVDYVFAPRLVSIERKEFTCPKLMGIPDILKSGFEELPPIIGPTIDLTKQKRSIWNSVWEIGKFFNSNPLKVAAAWQKGVTELNFYNQQWLKQEIPWELNLTKLKNNEGNLKIAVIGHEYIIYDQYLSLNLIEKLIKYRIKVLTIEMLTKKTINKETKDLPKKMFWNYAKNSLGTVFHLNRNNAIDGFIQISSFGCGPDSMINSLIQQYLKDYSDKPLLNLTIDEHTGEAGINTRIEAFYDLLTRRVG